VRTDTRTGLHAGAGEAGESGVRFNYLPLGHDVGAVVGGMFQTQLANGVNEGPVSMLVIVGRPVLGVGRLAHFCWDNQQNRLMTLRRL
jgi:hypothetical protein